MMILPYKKSGIAEKMIKTYYTLHTYTTHTHTHATIIQIYTIVTVKI